MSIKMANDKIVLEFTSDISGMKSAVEALKSLGQITDAQVEKFNQLNQTQTQGAEKATKSLVDLGNSMKAVGSNAVFASATKELEQLGAATTQSTKQFTSMRAELKSLKNSLQEMEDAGKTNTKEFEKMAVRAGHLADQIGDTQNRIKALADDSKYIKAFGQAVQGLASTFAVVQGATALFGAENKEVEKALLKVQAAMAIANGVQQINELLQKQSTIAVIAGNIATKSFAATQLFLAETLGISATAARGLTVAIAATGIGALLIAIPLLINAFDKWQESTKAETKTQKQLNEELDAQRQKMEAVIKASEDLAHSKDGGLNAQKREIELLKAKGASLSEIQKKEQEILKSELNDLVTRLYSYEDDAAKQIEIQELIKDKKNEIEVSKLAYEKATHEKSVEEAKKAEDKKKKIDDDAKKEKERKQKIISDYENDLTKVALSNVEKEKKEKEEASKKEAEILEDLMNGALADYDRDVAAKKKSEEEKLDAAKKRAEQEKALQKQVIQEAINTAKNLTDAIFQIEADARNHKTELELSKLDKLKTKELSNKNLTENQKFVIEEKFNKKEAEIKRKAWEQDQKAKIAQAIMNGALAITNILANTIDPTGVYKGILIGLSAATTASQIAVISSQKAPVFEKGGIIQGKRHSQGGTLIEAEQGEYVVNRTATAKHYKLIDSINKGIHLPIFNDATMSNMKSINQYVTNTTIDYDKLASSLAKKINDRPTSIINIDERGFEKRVVSLQSDKQFLQKRYSFKA